MIEQEYREDGWPLCPRCGEDELWSRVGARAATNAYDPPIKEYFTETFRCYRCDWNGRIEQRREPVHD